MQQIVASFFAWRTR